MNADRREIEVLSAGVHAALSAGHILAAVYNARGKRYGWAAFHTAAAILDLYAVREHYKSAREEA